MILDRLALDRHDDGTFTSRVAPDDGHVFGGLLVAQALGAATATVGEGRLVASLHASYLATGRGGDPLRHGVVRVRDGRSMATRLVRTSQSHGPVLVTTVELQDDEPGPDYQPPAPEGVPGPDDLPPGRYDSPMFESRDVEPGDDLVRRTWFRIREELPDDPAVHLQVLAFVSDAGLTRAAREPHAHLADDATRFSVSLDHGIWFHGAARADGWLLAEQRPLATGRGRGLALGTLRSAEGALLATVAQDTLLRTRP